MFTVRLKRFGRSVPLLACCALAGCGDDVASSPGESPNPSPTGTSEPRPDGQPREDAGEEGQGPIPCTGGAALAIAGSYTDASGTQHWLRRSASAVTYARVPKGTASHASPPLLWSITRVCSDQKVFVARSEASTYARVDWIEDPAGVALCVAIEGAPTAEAALAAALPVPRAPTGCSGGPWMLLTKKDGGL